MNFYWFSFFPITSLFMFLQKKYEKEGDILIVLETEAILL